MKCKHEKCSSHEDCGILEITGKEPETAESCSYFRSHKRAEKNKNQSLTNSEKKKLRRS